MRCEPRSNRPAIRAPDNHRVGYRGPQEHPYQPGITPRNMEMLKARFREGSRKEGARSIGMKDTTARWHMTRICRILGVNTAEQAVYVLWLRDIWDE